MTGLPKTGPDGKPIRLFRDAQAWEAWLAKNHDSSSGLWLRLAKKASGLKSVTFADALDVALCYGWIDSQGRGESESYSLQRFTPRAKRSLWSKRNREKVQALIDAGRMQPAGLAEIERAKQDGRWDAAYDSQSTATVPDDLRAALDANAEAAKAFAALDATNRYAILHRLQTAKKAETRARRIERFVQMLAEGRKLHD